MNTTQRRIALITGVSVAALGVPSMAHAATEPSIPYFSPPSDGTANICIDLSPDADCLFGVTNAGPGFVSSIVNDDPNGQLEVVGTAAAGNLNLVVSNTALATVEAIAQATGAASAFASVAVGLEVIGVAPAGDALVTIDLNADMNIIAGAAAVAAVGTFAVATANVTGIVEVASATSLAAAAFTNDATLDIAAGASAVGDGANASANAVGAVQVAVGGTAAVAAGDNNGVINVDALALAVSTGTVAAAAATAVADGILQIAVGPVAVADYDNVGTLEVDAVAAAFGPVATANATVTFALEQIAVGTIAAIADLSNTGFLQGEANAYASGITAANANALVNDVVVQVAAVGTGGLASATIGNVGGTISGLATANADAFGVAVANATLVNGIEQLATGGSVGGAFVTNAGTISFNAVANAGGVTLGTGTAAVFVPATTAIAVASVVAAIDQSATGVGTLAVAAATVANAGVLDIGASANASASSFAIAVARVDDGIEQNAAATGTGTAPIAAAGVSVTNSSVLAITADGSAVATGGTSPFALGQATVETGIDQEAGAFAVTATVATVVSPGGTAFFVTYAGDADATAAVNNNGSLDIAANAFASAAGTVALGTTNTGFALAIANVDDGIQQDVSAIGGSDADATAAVTNALGGALNISADASAVGVTNALAIASVDTGIDQEAFAQVFGGTASANVVLANAGAMSIGAEADAFAASGAANAVAIVDTGINQSAVAIGTGIGTVVVTPLGATFVFVGVADADVAMTNSGSLAITADADAVGTAAAAVASVDGINQNAFAFGLAGAAAGVAYTNAGTLGVTASATATGTVNAVAVASVSYGIDQSAVAISPFGPAAANVSLTNSGILGVNANAVALATVNASAYASVAMGIEQDAFASGTVAAASATLVNSGDLTIGANALASATSSAYASANIATGISQSATAIGSAAATAAVSLNNSGNLDIVANATALATGIVAPASGTAILFGSASAYASVATGIYQNAFASALTTATATVIVGPTTVVTYTYGGDANASADITNTGTLNIAANALASANSAYASAYVGDGIHQDATATGGTDADATATLTNGALAVLNISADASADGTFDAHATASVSDGIQQHAFAYVEDGQASANVTLTNAGAISITAEADADANGFDAVGDATNGHASANAYVGTGISQYASASGFGVVASIFTPTGTALVVAGAANATVALVNSGSIVIGADANANGDTASASAAVYNTAIYQDAFATGATGASAAASLTNTGAIGIGANAAAVGENLASANASVDNGIAQYATANTLFGAANANVSLTNSGAIGINATALASATNIARAYAFIDDGIFQSASASGSSGTASAVLVNSGSIGIGVDASATGQSASAFATINTAIQQNAWGVDAGLASLTNSGTIAITAEADAGNNGTATFATAGAFIGVGISQSATAFATGGVATATLVNTGGILISADAAGALASDGSAAASATIGTGIYQYASASSAANVGLVNDGTIDVLAAASAIADEDGTAVAGIGTLIYQSASAYGTGGDASVSLVNNGSLIADADATVFAGNDVYVSAYIGGIEQNGYGGTTGTANVALENNGLLSITADASGIGGGTGSGFAFASGGSQSAAAGSGATVSFVNNATVLVSADADIFVGNAAQKGATAVAEATAVGWYQGAFAGTADFTSNIVFTAAFPGTAVTSDTLAGVGFIATRTFTNTPSGPALAEFVNEGSFVVTANADAVGDDLALAVARASGLTQEVWGATATASVVNNGTMTVAAAAFASGDNGATAIAIADGIDQTATASAFTQEVLTFGDGTIHLTALGGTTLQSIDTSADRVITLSATPTGRALTTLTNTGAINVAATATAVVGGNDGPVTQTTAPPFALALADGIDQYAAGATATAIVDNSGSLAVTANAAASGVTAASALAVATGVSQAASAVAAERAFLFHYETVTTTDIFGHTLTAQTFVLTDTAVTLTNVGEASVILENSGSIDVAAVASAVAGSTAVAGAFAAGVFQSAAGTVANASVTNSGEINVLASAFASGTTGTASAGAIGIGQFLSGTAMNATFDNSGSLNVAAAASGAGAAFATATGYLAVGAGGGMLNMDVVNSSEILVSASAVAAGTAVASALGIGVINLPTVVGTAEVGNPVMGTVSNAGTLSVVAFASGGTFTTPTVGGGTTTLALSSANATGIYIASGINNMTVNNSGLISVDAITVNGGPATANGIWAESNGTATPVAGDVFTINNSGDIIVRVSTDGGDTFNRGMAIDVADVANNSVINLLGGDDGISLIYGNIDVQAGDQINVMDGETVFNGVINPECMPAGGPTALTLDNPAQNLCGQGNLTISGGGNLHLVIDGNEGPSYAFLDVFTVAADGTIEYDLPAPDGAGTIPIGTYPQIFTDVANLDGTLIANIPAPANGLYDDTVYENVIDAITRNGTFDQCIVNGVPATSLLLDFSCVYDNQANVDLFIDRIRFDAVPGLNGNGAAVGSGLECIYDVNMTGGIANMFANLFLFTDQVNYNIALNQLAGSSYANYLQSFPSLGVHYNDLIAKATDCEIPALAGSVLGCRASGPIHVWGQLDYQWRKADGDSEAGTTKAKRFTGLVGVDASVGNAAILGVSAGAVTNKTRDSQFGDNIEATGFQVGAYGVFDPGQFFVKAMTTYSWYDGDSERDISFIGLAPGATFTASLGGDPDVKMWTFGLRGGYRMGLGGNSVLTPYLNYDYVNARMKEFIEGGSSGAELHLDRNSAKHSFLTGGVKWATQMGGVVPEVNLGYRYRFGDKRTNITQAFLCQTDTCPFDVQSAGQKRGNFLAGVSVGGKIGPVDLRIGYEGEFNSDITSHSGNFRFVVPFGTRAAPPPPPPPPAPVVAPPPPVEVAPPPPPPPPPPAPVERGERGQ